MALTTRQRSKEHSSSSPRKAVRPLVVKQTEYSQRERTARCGKSSKVFILSFRAISLFSLVGFFCPSPNTGDFLPSRVILPGPLCSGREESAHRSQPGCKGTALCVTALPQSHQRHVRPLGQRVQGHLATVELTLDLKVGGKGQLFKESKRSIYQSMPKIELYLNCMALLENSQLS